MGHHYILIIVAFLLAGLVKGATGLGLPVVAAGLLSLAMPPLQAAALIVVPSLVTNIWQMTSGPSLRPLLARLWPLLAGICAGAWVGGALLSGVDVKAATAALGVAIMVYAVAGFLPFGEAELSLPWQKRLAPVAGVISGLIAAVTGVFVIPVVPYLQALRLDRDNMIQALGICFTTCTLALTVTLLATRHFTASAGLASMFAVAPALAGMFAGAWVRKVVSPKTFRIIFLVGMFGLGAHLASTVLH